MIVDYPTREEERQIIEQTTSTFESKLEPVIDGPTLQKCQETVRKVPCPTMFTIMFSDLVRMARPKEEGAQSWVKDLIDWGPGPRVRQQLILGSKVRALFEWSIRRGKLEGCESNRTPRSQAPYCAYLQCGSRGNHG